jgi:hypothetical protein
MKAYFHSLVGGDIKDDKRLINSKTPYALKDLPIGVLKFYYENEYVPASMKVKLKEAMGMSGGAVSKASGFIRRMAWDSEHKENPEWKLDWKKLASKEQGGENTSGNQYGASPFVMSNFKSPKTKPGKESDTQRVARINKWKPFSEEEASKILHEHFGSSEAVATAPVTKSDKPVVTELKSDTRAWFKDLPSMSKKLFVLVLDKPDATVQEAMSYLKRRGETNVKEEPVKRLLSTMKKEAADALKEAIESAEERMRS